MTITILRYEIDCKGSDMPEYNNYTVDVSWDKHEGWCVKAGADRDKHLPAYQSLYNPSLKEALRKYKTQVRRAKELTKKTGEEWKSDKFDEYVEADKKDVAAKEARKEIKLESGGGVAAAERNKAIAMTILQQLGGMNRLNIMTGAYNFLIVNNGVSFKIKNPRANYIKITLTSKDLYNLEIGRIRGDKYTIVYEGAGLYNDQLKPIIEEKTGMYLSLEEGGEISSMTEKDVLKKYFGANVYPQEIVDNFLIESKSISDDDRAEKYIQDLKSKGFAVKKKSYSEFTAITGVKRKDKNNAGAGNKTLALPPHQRYTTEYGKRVSGYQSLTEKALGEYSNCPVVYFVDDGVSNSYIVCSGILYEGEIINGTEAFDDWFGNEADALNVAYDMSIGKNVSEGGNMGYKSGGMLRAAAGMAMNVAADSDVLEGLPMPVPFSYDEFIELKPDLDRYYADDKEGTIYKPYFDTTKSRVYYTKGGRKSDKRIGMHAAYKHYLWQQYGFHISEDDVLSEVFKSKHRFYESGGEIDGYGDKTVPEVWNDWTPRQRKHFVKDHIQLLYGMNGENEPFLDLIHDCTYQEAKEMLANDRVLLSAIANHMSEGQYADGGEMTSALDADFWKKLSLLWRTEHIKYKNGKWVNSGMYKNISNNVSGLQLTDEADADPIVFLANENNVAVDDIKVHNPDFKSFEIYKAKFGLGNKPDRPGYAGTGRNISVFDYETENFDMSADAVILFEKMQQREKVDKFYVENAAKEFDFFLGIEKKCVETGKATDKQFSSAMSSALMATTLLEKSGGYEYLDAFPIVTVHLREIARCMPKSLRDGGAIVKQNILHIGKNVADLDAMIDEDADLEAWVEARIARANIDISDVTNYLGYQFTMGDGIGGDGKRKFKTSYLDIANTDDSDGAESVIRENIVVAITPVEAREIVQTDLGDTGIVTDVEEMEDEPAAVDYSYIEDDVEKAYELEHEEMARGGLIEKETPYLPAVIADRVAYELVEEKYPDVPLDEKTASYAEKLVNYLYKTAQAKYKDETSSLKHSIGRGSERGLDRFYSIMHAWGELWMVKNPFNVNANVPAKQGAMVAVEEMAKGGIIERETSLNPAEIADIVANDLVNTQYSERLYDAVNKRNYYAPLSNDKVDFAQKLTKYLYKTAQASYQDLASTLKSRINAGTESGIDHLYGLMYAWGRQWMEKHPFEATAGSAVMAAGGALVLDMPIFHDVMEEFKEGALKDRWGNVVKKKGQALAIAFSKARSVGNTLNHEVGGTISAGSDTLFNFNSFTLAELKEYLRKKTGDGMAGEISINFLATGHEDKYENRIKDYYEKKSLMYEKKFSIGDIGKQVTVEKGNENIYLDLSVYDNENKAYLIGLYSKENHQGLKQIAGEIIAQFKSGGQIEKKYKLGDKWSEDFDYDGMMNQGLWADANWSIRDLKLLHQSFESVNYHNHAKLLDLAIKAMEKGDTALAKNHFKALHEMLTYDLTEELEGDAVDYEVELEAVPNPDHDRDSNSGSIRIKKHRVPVASLGEAWVKVASFIEENDLGGGNFVPAKIYLGDVEIGYISYNGRLWNPDGTAMAMGDGGIIAIDKLRSKSKEELVKMYQDMSGLPAAHHDVDTLIAALHYKKRIKNLTDEEKACVKMPASVADSSVTVAAPAKAKKKANTRKKK